MTSPHLLLVDDDQDMLLSVQAFLASRGYKISTARSGADAKRLLSSLSPDLIVLDVMMETDSEGLVLAQELQRNPDTKSIPVVLLTAFLDHLDDKRASLVSQLDQPWSGAKLIEKPVQLESLAATIARLLEERQGMDAEGEA